MMRRPWELRLAAWSWAAAGVVFALTPALGVLLLQLQYAALKRGASRIADLSELVDTGRVLELERYLTEYERIEAAIMDASGWVLGIVLAVALGATALVLTGYLCLSALTARGANWARITATVLVCISTPIALIVWQAFAALSWLPIDALWANHLALVLIALHVTGTVLAWLPASNSYVREARLARSARRQARFAANRPASAAMP